MNPEFERPKFERAEDGVDSKNVSCNLPKHIYFPNINKFSCPLLSRSYYIQDY